MYYLQNTYNISSDGQRSEVAYVYVAYNTFICFDLRNKYCSSFGRELKTSCILQLFVNNSALTKNEENSLLINLIPKDYVIPDIAACYT